MKYIEVSLTLPESEVQKDILVALLGEIGYDSFMEDENCFKAYCPEQDFDQKALQNILMENTIFAEIQFLSAEKMPEKDWNEIWELSYEPVIVNEKCRIRAPFHEADDNYLYDLVIEPKMSFGTAHHETTSQLIELMSRTDFTDRDVLDMGSGTAVLAILAKKLGAKTVIAIDNDEWAYRNALDNIIHNDTQDIVVELGNATTIGNRTFDIILANINRNILLNDMHHYAKALRKNGLIFFSGFYTEDLEAIKKEAAKLQMQLKHFESKNNWVAAIFEK
ncbi:MAG: 50S ribosomal protein L11 methyltransferase [Lentimicrobiaceae bacterium]|jgi:ribosomal protein L11 methyltransferase|nr:50S ribosomal protein L11 methyltransferase [Lentimicrobiaceae bacterium]